MMLNVNDSTKGLLFKLTSLFMVLTFLFIAVFSYYAFFQGKVNDQSYAEVVKLFDAKDMSVSNNGVMSRFLPLLSKNSHTSGFIDVPQTNIYYPVMQSPDDPHFYANHDFYKASNKFGTPYFSSENNILVDNFNYIIYGNNTNDGQMFSDLLKYSDPSFYEKAQVVNLSTLYIEQKYIVFAAFIADQSINYCKTGFYDDIEFLNYIDESNRRSLIKTEVEVLGDDSMLTLVCKSDEYEGAKFVVLARRVRDYESYTDILGSASLSESPLMPDRWYSINAKPKPDYVPKFLSDEDSYPNSGFEDPPESLTHESSQNNSSSESPELPSNGSSITEPSSNKSSSSQKASSGVSSKTSSAAVSSSVKSQTSSTVKPPSSSSPPVSSSVSSVPPTPPPVLGQISVKNQSAGGAVVTGTPEYVIAMVVEGEMGASFHEEALKAQTIAAYSWLLANGAATGGAPGAPMKTAAQKTINAVNAVIGKTVKYGGKTIASYYFAMSAGRTANPEDIWGNSLAYCKSVDSSVEKNVINFETTKTFTASYIAQILGVDINKVSDRSKLIEIKARDANNLYVKTVSVATAASISGTGLRDKFGTSVIRSPAFGLSYDKAKDEFTFTVNGYGHGVGLSQHGANEYAKQGRDYMWILNHYYTGITVS